MKGRIIRRGAAIISRVTTTGVLNGHGKIHTDTKITPVDHSYQGSICPRSGEFHGARQGNARQAEPSQRLGCIVAGVLVVIGFMLL